MSLQLHVFGPGVDERRRLEPGEPALIVGRDSDCAIWLPDPHRNVSRRHLSVWNEGGLLQFHVLSLVNGVHAPAGDLPPGARGVLAPGEELVLSDFRIAVSLVDVTAAAPRPFLDTWAQLQHAAERLPHPDDPTAPAPVHASAPQPASAPARAPEDDPFGDWGFHSTFGPGVPGGPRRADALVPAVDLQPFLAGLGLEASAVAGLTRAELEMIGRITRIALQGLLQASEAVGGSRREAQAGDAPTAQQREPNPLRGDTPIEAKLQYLFGGAAASAGLLPPDRAVAQLATELAAHARSLLRAKRNTGDRPDG